MQSKGSNLRSPRFHLHLHGPYFLSIDILRTIDAHDIGLDCGLPFICLYHI